MDMNLNACSQQTSLRPSALLHNNPSMFQSQAPGGRKKCLRITAKAKTFLGILAWRGAEPEGVITRSPPSWARKPEAAPRRLRNCQIRLEVLFFHNFFE